MIDISKSNIVINFDVIEFDNKTMSLHIFNENQEWKIPKLPPGKFSWSGTITFPTKLTMLFGNRAEGSIIFDDDGNVVKNMSVVIDSIYIDNTPCWNWWLDSSIVLECDNLDESIVLGRYICENGKVDLLFDEPNAFFWLSKTRLAI